MLRQGAEVIGFCAWREGLVLRPGHAVSGITDVIKAGLRLVNRQPGSEARLLLDRELATAGADPAQLPGYDSQATGHLHVASAVAAGLADVGVASEPAALAYGLAFIPLAAERFDLVIPAGQAGSREVPACSRCCPPAGCSTSSPACPATTRRAAASTSPRCRLFLRRDFEGSIPALTRLLLLAVRARHPPARQGNRKSQPFVRQPAY